MSGKVTVEQYNEYEEIPASNVEPLGMMAGSGNRASIIEDTPSQSNNVSHSGIDLKYSQIRGINRSTLNTIISPEGNEYF